MPKGKNKKFIDKNNSVTFHLVHRSQQDPLAADETAPQRVLVPIDSVQAPKSDKKSVDIEKRREEQQKFGIFFDDDYDYLQHLKDVNKLEVEWARADETEDDNKLNKKNEQKNKPKINLPSSVFASAVEEDVGLLNKAAPISGPRLDFDPDIVAAMDDDFNYDDPDNELEDNFMELANGVKDVEFNEEDEYEFDSDEERDEVCSLDGPQYSFKDEETRSRFTEYSMSSSVIRRNEQLSLLDDKFEKMYAAYDENEIGALDCEEIEGHVGTNADILLQYAEEFEKQQNEPAENVAALMKDRLKIIETNYSSSDDDLEELIIEPPKKEFDCESIISTYNNIYNHPKLLAEPKKIDKLKIDKRTGIPKDVLNGRTGKLTIKSLAQLDRQNQLLDEPTGPRSIAETMKSTISMLSVRPKDELSGERRERKKALKNYRKERRIERKANTEAFKEEKKRQEKIMLNNRNNSGVLFAK